ncbi:MAG TPA: hypothetical protein PKE62_05185 [Anaerolineales bacterium]|nr:hypothetical protein [Anaerolineales bacterium]
MKRYKQILLGFVLIISSACGNLQIQPEAPSMPTSAPGAVNTYIAQTAEVAYTQTAFAASPTPTLAPTFTATATPLPTITVRIEQLRLESSSLLIIGQLYGALAETSFQSFATLSLYDSQGGKLIEQETPCIATPNEADKLCLFVFSMTDLPAGLASYEINGKIQMDNGLILTSRAEGLFAKEETLANATAGDATPISSSAPQLVQPTASISKKDVSVRVSFSSLFYRPENGSSLNADATYFGDPAIINASNVELCASIVEQRKYESGKTAQVTLTDECKAAYFSGSDKIASASADFFFKPSGYSFVLTDSPDGRYQILDVRASVALKQNQQVLTTSEQSHRPVPVRVIDTSLYNSQATATVEIMAGQGQTYDLALRVYQVERDPDETFWSFFLAFAPCLFPEICRDRERVKESFQPIKLMAGTNASISTSFSAAPVSEEGNFIIGYEMLVYFEDSVIGRR